MMHLLSKLSICLPAFAALYSKNIAATQDVMLLFNLQDDMAEAAGDPVSATVQNSAMQQVAFAKVSHGLANFQLAA